MIARSDVSRSDLRDRARVVLVSLAPRTNIWRRSVVARSNENKSRSTRRIFRGLLNPASHQQDRAERESESESEPSMKIGRQDQSSICYFRGIVTSTCCTDCDWWPVSRRHRSAWTALPQGIFTYTDIKEDFVSLFVFSWILVSIL